MHTFRSILDAARRVQNQADGPIIRALCWLVSVFPIEFAEKSSRELSPHHGCPEYGDLCSACSAACFHEAMNHCLEAGGDHLEPEHFRLMMVCSEICRSSAVVMLTGVPQHVFVCNACVEVRSHDETGTLARNCQTYPIPQPRPRIAEVKEPSRTPSLAAARRL